MTPMEEMGYDCTYVISYVMEPRHNVQTRISRILLPPSKYRSLWRSSE